MGSLYPGPDELDSCTQCGQYPANHDVYSFFTCGGCRLVDSWRAMKTHAWRLSRSDRTVQDRIEETSKKYHTKSSKNHSEVLDVE